MHEPTCLLIFSSSNFGVLSSQSINPFILASVTFTFLLLIKLRNSFKATRESWSCFCEINLLTNPIGLLAPIFPVISEIASLDLIPKADFNFSNVPNNSS